MIISKGEIKIENVSMKYKKDAKLILNNKSFACPDGKKLAIIGGAGKSSIRLALMELIYKLLQFKKKYFYYSLKIYTFESGFEG